jgi:Protein of unknown function (DUF2637)
MQDRMQVTASDGGVVSVSLTDNAQESASMADMTPRWTRPQTALAAVIIVTVTALAPLFFADLFVTVNHLLGPSFGWWAWTVPLATEVSFVVLYLLAVLLMLRGKPARGLAWVPYLFAAASLWLNVAAAHGNPAAEVGHAVMVAAFFAPILAAKAAVRSLSTSGHDVAVRRVSADARRYAIDLMRSELGWRWRLSAPRLMRRQVITGRLPHAVTAAVRESLTAYGDPWEPAVEKWVVDGLTKSVKVAAEVKREKRVIEAAVTASPQAAIEAALSPQKAGRKPVSTRAAKAEHVRRLLSDGTPRTRPEIAALAGVSVATVDRIKAVMPTPLRVAR